MGNTATRLILTVGGGTSNGVPLIIRTFMEISDLTALEVVGKMDSVSAKLKISRLHDDYTQDVTLEQNTSSGMNEITPQDIVDTLKLEEVKGYSDKRVFVNTKYIESVIHIATEGSHNGYTVTPSLSIHLKGSKQGGYIASGDELTRWLQIVERLHRTPLN